MLAAALLGSAPATTAGAGACSKNRAVGSGGRAAVSTRGEPLYNRAVAKVDGSGLLVMAAFSPELDAFAPLLGASMSAPVGDLPVSAVAVGIGLVAAAIGAARALDRLAPRAVVLVGTCGAYPSSGLRALDVVVARAVLLVEPAAVMGAVALPEPMSTRLDANAAMSASLASAGTTTVDVATTLGVTVSDDLATRLGGLAAVEHMEAFAVATACALRGTPCAAVLGVANRVGATGRSEWRKNHAAAGRAVGSVVTRWLEAGAAGVPWRREGT